MEGKIMKKIIALLAAMLMLVSLAACSSSSTTQTNTNQTAQTAQTDETPQGGKTLVVYFSATNNTENVAGYIAEITGADTFEIEPATPYSADDLNWRDDDSRVVYEHENETAQDVELVSTTVENWDDYDTVFIGYPIWWGNAAWVVNGFVTANDFSGKTVIPFCTSSSSDIGESDSLLAEMAGTGNWQAGERFSANADQAAVQAWLDTLTDILPTAE
jgi:flavodoxin